MIGMYAAVIGAVDDRAFGDLALVGIGAVVDLALFSTLLGWLLDHHGDTVMAAMVGLMLGSLRVLWPWPNGVGVIEDESEVIDGTGLELPAGDEFLGGRPRHDRVRDRDGAGADRQTPRALSGDQRSEG